MRYYKNAIHNYLNFSGYATRTEYWMFFIMNIVITALITIAQKIVNADGTLFTWLYSIFIFCPTWAISVRRLHDSGKSGLWLLVNLIPGIGQFIHIILMLLPSKR